MSDKKISEYSIDTLINAAKLANDRFDATQKGIQKIHAVECECERPLKDVNDAKERGFFLLDTEEEIFELLENTPNLDLQRYMEKLINEEKLEANKKLYLFLEKEITAFVNENIDTLEKNMSDWESNVQIYIQTFSVSEKKKIKHMINEIMSASSISPKYLLEKYGMESKQNIYTTKKIIGEFLSLKIDMNNFVNTAKEKISQIISGLVILDEKNHQHLQQKNQGMEMITMWNTWIDNLQNYYENEIKQIRL